MAVKAVVFQKDSDAHLDYAWDWSKWLGPSEEIVDSEMIATPGISVTGSTFTQTKTVAWVSGGQAGQPYTVTNRIETNQGRIDDRTITIRVVNR